MSIFAPKPSSFLSKGPPSKSPAIGREIRALWEAHPCREEKSFDDFRHRLLADAMPRPLPSESFLTALDVTLKIVLEDNDFYFPDPPQHHAWNAEDILHRLSRDRAFAASRSLTELFGHLVKLCPESINTEHDGEIGTPLVSLLKEPKQTVQSVIDYFLTVSFEEQPLFPNLRRQVFNNTVVASGLDPESYDGKRKLTRACDSDLSPSQLVDTYLFNTPFQFLLNFKLPFDIPERARFEHMHVIAGSGHGKTQLLQHLILNDLQRPDPPSLIVIDSQGEMLRKLQRLALFAENPERLIIIDPEQYSPALNMFDITNARAEGYSELHREQLQAGIVELYNYIFASIAAEMTSRQSTAFAFVARLMLAIPGATIHTLRELMEDGAQTIEQSQFRDAIEKLEPTARAYFQNQFFTKRYSDLKQSIARRLYGVLSVPAFDRMFSAPRNGLDMFAAMQGGKIVLVNTSKALLKSEASALFGRTVIALVIRAVYERVASPDRHPTFLFVDEASEYFDDNIQVLLEQARKFNVGLVLAHQHLDQLSPSLRSAIAANTAIKLSGGVNDRDARALAPDMRSSADFITSVRKDRAGTQFACYVRNHTEQALRLDVPFGSLEAAPQMTDAQEKKLIERNRERYAARREEPRPAATSLHEPPRVETEPDDWRS